jgi:hypothetical protein
VHKVERSLSSRYCEASCLCRRPTASLVIMLAAETSNPSRAAVVGVVLDIES